MPENFEEKGASKIIRKFPGIVVEAEISGEIIRFFVNNPEDWIQRHHNQGEFYEVIELGMMAQHMTPETRYLDIGANIGNHIIWLSKYVGITNIVAVEPNPRAMAILEVNMQINGLTDTVDLSCIGYGLSDRAGLGTLRVPQNNLGGARLVESTDHGLKVMTGDELLAGRDFDFIKMDVEGMEIACLTGLSAIIKRCRPTIFIEVEVDNTQAFLTWIGANDYSVIGRHKPYSENENFLIKPIA